MALYPLLFTPIEHTKLWGSESWQISGIENEETVVANGFLKGNTLNELISVYLDEFLGGRVYKQYGEYFPLLFKFIDAKRDLSIQVHPNNAHAQQIEELGKDELWYVTKAKKDCNINLGFIVDTDYEEMHKVLHEGTILNYLQFVPIEKGDVAYIPAGLVHSLGGGICVAEIQQASDVTYRLYDYERADSEGNTRPLHIHEALEVCDYHANRQPLLDYDRTPNKVTPLPAGPHFTTNFLCLQNAMHRDYAELDSFVVYMCCEGRCSVQAFDTPPIELSEGQSMLLPAAITQIDITPLSAETVLLETHI